MHLCSSIDWANLGVQVLPPNVNPVSTAMNLPAGIYLQLDWCFNAHTNITVIIFF